MGVRLVVQLAPTPIGYVRVQLGRREIGMAEHFLDRAEVRAAFEQVRRERVPQQVRVHTGGIEAGLLGSAPENQECAGARERPALRVEEELGAVAAVEMRPAARQV